MEPPSLFWIFPHFFGMQKGFVFLFDAILLMIDTSLPPFIDANFMFAERKAMGFFCIYRTSSSHNIVKCYCENVHIWCMQVTCKQYQQFWITQSNFRMSLHILTTPCASQTDKNLFCCWFVLHHEMENILFDLIFADPLWMYFHFEKENVIALLTRFLTHCFWYCITAVYLHFLQDNSACFGNYKVYFFGSVCRWEIT